VKLKEIGLPKYITAHNINRQMIIVCSTELNASNTLGL
jgi:hypothetical protein